jgi:hypothetical protein
MFIEAVKTAYPTQKKTRGFRLISLFFALTLALTICARKAKAQVVDDLEVNVPFEFHAGDEEGRSQGSQMMESRYEKRIAQAAIESQEHVQLAACHKD